MHRLAYVVLPVRFDFDSISTSIRLRSECNSIALRPFDDLRHDRAVALRPK